MKKLVLCILSFMLVGCTSQKESMRILCPTGAPSLAFVSEYENLMKDGQIDFVDGSHQLIAEMSKENSDYDMIVAPINIGTSLIEKGQTDYRLKAILTWGNLYLVGQKDGLKGEGEIALFGEGTVPQKIYDLVDIETSLKPVYYQSATLVQQQLLANKVKVGMLAEPLAFATMTKAKQNGMELSILEDLQSAYGEEGYPQAAIFVKDNHKSESLLEKVDVFTNHGYEGLKECLEIIGVEKLNLPSVDIALQTIDRQNIHYQEAHQHQKEIKDFLQLFDIQFSEDMLIK